MKAYLDHGILFESKDLEIIIGNTNVSIEVEITPAVDLVTCDNIFVNGDFNEHKIIEVQLGTLSNGLEPEDINCYSYFEVDVTMSNGEDPVYEVKDRNFKIEHLSMELQKRIHDKADEMYQDWMKTIVND